MKLLTKRNTSISQKPIHTSIQNQRDCIKQEIRLRISETLQAARNLPPEERVDEIRFRLFAMQNYCRTVEKTFVVVEQQITCDQFDLDGCADKRAILFQGSSEDVSVAICVTYKGSLLHRTPLLQNSCPWKLDKNEGDIDSVALFRPAWDVEFR